jgi:hypothetical protein
MPHHLFGRAHAALVLRLSRERGQGTVEYVGLILLMAVVLAAVVGAASKTDAGGIAETVVNKLKGAIDQVGGDKSS